MFPSVQHVTARWSYVRRGEARGPGANSGGVAPFPDAKERGVMLAMVAGKTGLVHRMGWLVQFQPQTYR